MSGIATPMCVCGDRLCPFQAGHPKVITLRHEARPWTLNVERQGNRWKRAALVKEWRTKFAELAIGAAPMHAVAVIAQPELRNRAAMPDTGACIGAVKAAIDGLVDAGVLVEDGPAVVRSLTFLAPVVTGTDALEIEVQEIL
jgi:hypothetical protein